MPEPRLTIRLLKAMDAALTAMLAGEAEEGDWPEGMPKGDLEDAQGWVTEQIARRQGTSA